MKHTFTAARVWLYMAEQGGMWTAPELAEACGLERDKFRMHLYHWSNIGIVVKHGPAYGVTRACKPPHGLTLGEIETVLKAGTGE